ncbi:uncharacterized protein F4822DRAFT_428262 [Hypoxylon trugodes]|uniref:uncharacterized protein n=1 Tax=Hypoxylon trugodes TaxID=326681 RepID=UPI00218FE39B|nr:uncharacterized protein F4822DRAFT_428262 [Hypoxylon trugodes]KAI1389921.1 hypothetical protein F4822DRAFT_428262 [Hypoxylon trugodes]
MRFNTLTTSILAAATSASAACLEQAPSALGFPINFDITPATPATISFLIPSNAPAGPCELIVKFPDNYPITSTGDDLVNVTATTGPVAGSLIGSVRFRAGTKTVINSFACEAVMGFEFAIAQGQGEVKFSEIAGAGVFLDIGDVSQC